MSRRNFFYFPVLFFYLCQNPIPLYLTKKRAAAFIERQPHYYFNDENLPLRYRFPFTPRAKRRADRW